MIQNDSAEFVPTPPTNSSIFQKNVHLKNANNKKVSSKWGKTVASDQQTAATNRTLLQSHVGRPDRNNPSKGAH